MGSPEPESLSFDKAQFEESGSASLTCLRCQSGLVGTYFEVNGQTVCEPCRTALESVRAQGSPVSRAARALFGGAVGGFFGAVLWYAIGALTGLEIGLVAIVVGLLVGFGVRWGSRGVGGRGYQALAVAITYMSIVSTYVPAIVEGIRNQPETAETEVAPVGTEVAPVGTEVAPLGTEVAPVETEVEMTLGTVALGLAALMAFAMIAPFLAGFESLLWLLIIGIALYEAWKVNAYVPLVVEGPFQIGGRPKETPS